MGIFRAADELGAQKDPLTKIYHLYLTRMKLSSYTLTKENPRDI